MNAVSDVRIERKLTQLPEMQPNWTGCW